jgi:hypothetical protein
MTFTRVPFPGILRNSMRPPSGMQIKEAIKTEDKDMERDRAVISITS